MEVDIPDSCPEAEVDADAAAGINGKTVIEGEIPDRFNPGDDDAMTTTVTLPSAVVQVEVVLAWTAAETLLLLLDSETTTPASTPWIAWTKATKRATPWKKRGGVNARPAPPVEGVMGGKIDRVAESGAGTGIGWKAVLLLPPTSVDAEATRPVSRPMPVPVPMAVPECWVWLTKTDVLAADTEVVKVVKKMVVAASVTVTVTFSPVIVVKD